MNTLETVERPVSHAPIRELSASLAVVSLPIGVNPMVAHQGGWDEILMVVAPLAVIGGLLWLANRRVTAQLENELQGGTEDSQGDSAANTGDASLRSSGDDGQD